MLPRSPSIRLLSCINRELHTPVIAVGFWVSMWVVSASVGEASEIANGAGNASIRLAEGSVIVGAITDMRDDIIYVKTAFSDEDLAINASLVESLEWLERAELLMDDNSLVVVPAIKVTAGKIALNGQSVPFERIAIMNPADWEEGKGYHWTGDTSTAIAFNRGNTETDEFDVKLNMVLTSTRDRFTVNSYYERDDAYNRTTVANSTISQKVVTADNWKVLGKYDYFLSDSRNYFGTNASVEADSLAGVSLRTYVGPYVGRRLLNTDAFQLDGELGFAYVNTDYASALNQQDNDYLGVNWNLTGESNLFGGDSRLYLRHVGIMDASDAQQLILKNTVGLAFPLLYGLEGAAEITLDYDGTAADDREELDQVYSLRVGYAW